MLLSGNILFGSLAKTLSDDVGIAFMFVDDAVNLAPFRQSSDVPVVDKVIGFHLTAEVIVLFGFLFGIVTVYRPEVNAPLMTPVDGVLQELSFAHCPQNEPVVLTNKHAERVGSERDFFSYFGITVLNDGTVKVYSYRCHYRLTELSFASP